ncbi:C-type mannose receptor 2-like [Bombyx mandarina]|uniref:C-type lectin 10 n=2 Tax=Bombyx TaxID=7090 RepID=D2X2F6_BOMMO|nr:C-type lectin 19 precursor [Bombyx mori]XP_028031828.1 C-type mannose receptor 2-like [Bombyx mandarina]ADB12587.1 C-type lectin 10 [Bombyx mori]
MKAANKSLVFVLILICSVVGQQFRYDYTYFRNINGWLKLQEIPAIWQEARLRCRLEGSVLASPLDAALKSSMLSLITNKKSSCGIYTGIHALFSKGDFRSIEGVPLAKIPHDWADYEPDNAGGDENCILMYPDGNFADVNCTDTFQYVCYKKKTSTVAMSSCGSVDSEYTLSKETGNCYKFHKVPRTWSRAYMTCLAEGGYLTIINSQQEATFLKELFAKNPASHMVGRFWKDIAFIGLHDWNEHGEWLTINGETLPEAGYDKWSAGEPNNSTGGEYCGSIYRSALINDLWCGRPAPFICEKEPRSLLREHDDK